MRTGTGYACILCQLDPEQTSAVMLMLTCTEPRQMPSNSFTAPFILRIQYSTPHSTVSGIFRASSPVVPSSKLGREPCIASHVFCTAIRAC